ncbi:MAG: electron transfer flavoprotein subunit beta/FixA family protein, partial [Bdellovibrionales bacterium]|nr:electron transfer flavoprotein subunit beta/FixA family protein [Bdellovibrionales bacterium]
TETKLSINGDSTNINTENIKWTINPYDEFAIEEALKTKASTGASVEVISVGPKTRVTEALRTALAMGADTAICIDTPDNLFLSSDMVAQAIAKTLQKKDLPDLIFTGKVGIDYNFGLMLFRLGEKLNMPVLSGVSKLELKNKTISATKEIDGGEKQNYELNLPAIIGATKGLNTPRYPNLPGIMKAKRKPIEEISFSELNISPDTSFYNYNLPGNRPDVNILSGTEEEQINKLITNLKEQKAL